MLFLFLLWGCFCRGKAEAKVPRVEALVDARVEAQAIVQYLSECLEASERSLALDHSDDNDGKKVSDSLFAFPGEELVKVGEGEKGSRTYWGVLKKKEWK